MRFKGFACRAVRETAHIFLFLIKFYGVTPHSIHISRFMWILIDNFTAEATVECLALLIN